MMEWIKVLNLLIAAMFAPLLFGIINRTKAVFAGRKGKPLLQAYYDILKLCRKGAVYSVTTSWIFRAGPVAGFAGVITAALLVPFGGIPAVLSFEGDFILFAYIFGMMRFFTVLMAIDTGSSFQGMGASREVLFSSLAEPAFLVSLMSVLKFNHTFSLSGLTVINFGPVPLLAAFAVFIVFLAENSRIPVDDPNTHLELTMIHEVIILDNSGPDFAMITYTSALKMWLLGSILVSIIVPSVCSGVLFLGLNFAVMFCIAILVGVVESSMARLRLLHVPQLLLIANALAALAMILVLRS